MNPISCLCSYPCSYLYITANAEVVAEVRCVHGHLYINRHINMQELVFECKCKRCEKANLDFSLQ